MRTRPSPAARPSAVLNAAALAACACLLAACGSAPMKQPGAAADAKPGPRASSTTARSNPSPDRDGPEAQPPANLAAVPDAEPQVEAIRAGGPNKPYEVLGRSYVPITQDTAHVERGLASWYGRKFHGRRTALGEVYDMYAMTAAHPTLPLPSYVKVRNPANGREVIVRVNDRGPFHSNRIIDLSYTAALKLDLLRGVAPVEIERLTFEAIRSGQWRGSSTGTAVASATAAEPARPAVAPNANSAPPPAVPAAPTAAEAFRTADAGTRGTSAPVAIQNTAEAPVGTPVAANVPPSALLQVSTAEPAATATPTNAPQPPVPTSGYYVQIGAFKQIDGAENFHRKVVADLSWLSPLLAVFTDASSVHRLQAGPYRTRDEAQGVAQQVREALRLVPMVVQRR